jgi:hypothetical protein
MSSGQQAGAPRPPQPSADPGRNLDLRYTVEMAMLAVVASVWAGFGLCWTVVGRRHGSFVALQADVAAALQDLLPRGVRR